MCGSCRLYGGEIKRQFSKIYDCFVLHVLCVEGQIKLFSLFFVKFDVNYDITSSYKNE